MPFTEGTDWKYETGRVPEALKESGRPDRQTDRHATTWNHIQRNSNTQLQLRWEEKRLEEPEGRLQLGKESIYQENVLNAIV